MSSDELHQAVCHIAATLRGVDTGEVWCNLTCREIESIADVLREGGHEDEADFLIREHGVADEDPEDMHHEFYDPQHSHA